MPTTLDKTRKQISKKRNGDLAALHTKSRNSMRLHKANVRDQRLDKIAAARSKKEQPILDRAVYFREGLRDKGGSALEVAAVQDLIKAFIHPHEEEYDELRKSRRSGRPSSGREDLLKLKISALKTEHEQGFLLPDLLTQDSVNLLERWEGSWSFLTTIPWIKVSSAGLTRKAEFPSKGIN